MSLDVSLSLCFSSHKAMLKVMSFEDEASSPFDAPFGSV